VAPLTNRRLIPLAAILSPATLTTAITTHINETTCPNIRTIDFDQESSKDFRIGVLKPNGYLDISLCFYNTTDLNGTAPGFIDYFDEPSTDADQYVNLGAYLGKPATLGNISTDICGAGWNCSYTISFTAPGYKCTERASGIGSDTTTAPFNTSILLPQGKYGYYAKVLQGEYARPQMDVGLHGIPVQPAPYPDNLGAFRVEPPLWIGYSIRNDRPADPNNKTQKYEPKIFSCEHWETNYTVQFNQSAGQQLTQVLKRTFIAPIVDTTLLPNANSSDGTLDTTVATPASNYILPKPSSAVGTYRKVAAYHSIGLLVRRWLDGYVDLSKTWAMTATLASSTRLLAGPRSDILPVPDLMEQVQTFYEDIILSLLANPGFVVVVNATPPAGVAVPQYEYPCTRYTALNTYVYHVRDLWLGYGAAILVAAVALYVGAHSVGQNGNRVRDTHFSTIIASTRGSALEGLGWKRWSPGGRVPPHELKNARLGYGVVKETGDRTVETPNSPGLGAEYWGFGVEGDVRLAGSGKGVIGLVKDYRRSMTNLTRQSWDSRIGSPR
jgi:hypothetical protein